MLCESSLKKLLADAKISVHQSVLCVCGGSMERVLFSSLGFTDVTISNVDEGYSGDLEPFKWSYQDAENLRFADGSFDIICERRPSPLPIATSRAPRNVSSGAPRCHRL